MKYNINKQNNTKEYQKSHRDLLKSDEVWNDMTKDKNVSKYHELLRTNNDSQYTNYTIEVKNIPLEINHREIMEHGINYLFQNDVVVDIPSYWDEYMNWYTNFHMKLTSKSEVNMSMKDLSTKQDTQNSNFINGQIQYLDGWMRYLKGLIEPDTIVNEVGDKTGVYSSLFSQSTEWVSEVTGSKS